MSATNLISFAPVILAQGGTILGVGVELTSMDEFLEETRWPFDLVTDESRQAYKKLELKNQGCSSCWGICICCNSVGTWYDKASKLGYKNNTAGNWTQYGGTMLLAGRTGTLLYAHKQVENDFEPDIDAMLIALNATAEQRNLVNRYPAPQAMT